MLYVIISLVSWGMFHIVETSRFCICKYVWLTFVCSETGSEAAPSDILKRNTLPRSSLHLCPLVSALLMLCATIATEPAGTVFSPVKNRIRRKSTRSGSFQSSQVTFASVCSVFAKKRYILLLDWRWVFFAFFFFCLFNKNNLVFLSVSLLRDLKPWVIAETCPQRVY